MKRILKYTLLLAIVATVSSCMEEVGDFTVKGEAITGFELSTPANSASLKINTGTLTETFVFSWINAESGLGSPLQYTILFDVPDGDFSNPKWSKGSDNSGAATKATLTFQELQQILTAAGSGGGTVKWNVKAENGSPNVKMGQVANLLKLSLSTAGVSNFKLTSPPDKSILQIDGTLEKDTLRFDWANATATSGKLIYKFYLDKVGGDFSNPLLTLDADASGAASQISMTHGQWKTLFDQYGIKDGAYSWTAKAISSDLEWMKESNEIFIEIVNWRKPIFIVGEATEVGWDIGNALEMTFISPNVWSGTFMLKAGKEFKFFPEKGSWDNGIGADRFETFVGCSNPGNGNIKNDGTVDKYYLVTVNLNTKTVEVTDNPLFIVGEATEVGWDIGNALEMKYVSSNVWTGAFILKAGKEFKFFPKKGSWDNGIGADRFENFIGCSSPGNGNIKNSGTVDMYYLVVVDLNTKTVTVADNPKILGGSVIADWNPTNAVPMQMVAPGIFDTYQYITVDGWGFKLVPTNSGWDGDFGKSKTIPGFLAQADEDNLTVATDGFYRVRTNFNDMSYSIVETAWGIIGDATPGGWGTDTNMSMTAAKGQYTWKADIIMTSGSFKFRANDDWGINLGDDGANGSLEYNGGNISVTAGNYHIELILNSATGFTYTITPK